jgi:hypothetical protein
LRHLIKNLGNRMPENVVLDIRVQGVMQLRSGRRDQDPAKDRPPTLTSLCVARGPELSKMRALTELCGLRVSVETYVATKGPF